jgi:hypothetical protein
MSVCLSVFLKHAGILGKENLGFFFLKMASAGLITPRLLIIGDEMILSRTQYIT